MTDELRERLARAIAGGDRPLYAGDYAEADRLLPFVEAQMGAVVEECAKIAEKFWSEAGAEWRTERATACSIADSIRQLHPSSLDALEKKLAEARLEEGNGWRTALNLGQLGGPLAMRRFRDWAIDRVAELERASAPEAEIGPGKETEGK